MDLNLDLTHEVEPKTAWPKPDMDLPFDAT